ncbi:MULTISPECIES: PqqD family protein [unclassified Thiocapsa]|uniref:PqqD family protein n=1 Tax=unclassified Thiocapsa TaxID=2641286 RepID=UPI0035B0A1EC
MISTALDNSRLIARPGDRRLCVLDAAASALWDLHTAGVAPERLAGLLVERFALPPAPARDQVMALVADWRLARDGDTVERGRGLDTALLATLTALSHLGCRPAEQLIVLHGAGLVAPDGQGLLLVAPDGSGKTTLAAALNAAGFALLSDDVVPVTPAGDLLGLNLPLCLKPGSWPMLTPFRPDLEQAPVVARFGQRVRFVPARGPAVTGPVRPVCLLLPRYAPEAAACVAPLSPVQALQGSSAPKRCSATSRRRNWLIWPAGSRRCRSVH